jgi:hypothetical protein
MNNLFAKLTGNAPGTKAIGISGVISGTAEWTHVAPGALGVGVTIEASASSVYVSDGVGVAFSALRFRRIDLRSGEETASFRSGTPVRCLTLVEDDELIAATDSKLFRLGARTLEERQRSEHRIPRYSSSMAAADSVLLVANATDPEISIVDLRTGRVRRRPAPSMPRLLGAGDRILAVGGDAGGGLVAVNARDALVTPLAQTPSALDAWMSPRDQDLYLLAGVRYVTTPNSASVGKASSELVHYPDPAVERLQRYRLPKPARGIAGDGPFLWCIGDPPGHYDRSQQGLVLVPLPISAEGARLWSVPRNETIAAVDPASRRVITERSDSPAGATTLTCYHLEVPA